MTEDDIYNAGFDAATENLMPVIEELKEELEKTADRIDYLSSDIQKSIWEFVDRKEVIRILTMCSKVAREKLKELEGVE